MLSKRENFGNNRLLSLVLLWLDPAIYAIIPVARPLLAVLAGPTSASRRSQPVSPPGSAAFQR
jgi:hypothetical protein